MLRHSWIAVVRLIAATLAYATASAQQPPDTLLVNGRIFTGTSETARVEALAVRGDLIIAAGTTAQIKHMAGPKTRSIDLHGFVVIPGINDAHYHLDISPADTVEVETESPDPSWQEMRAALALVVAKTPRGVLLSAEMGPTLFHDPAVSRAQLDQVAPLHPVMIVTMTGHAAFLNSAALMRFGIAETQQDPVGGKYERGADGKLTGVLREYALLQLERSMADHVPDAQAIAQLRKQLTEAAVFGITSLQDMSNAASPERATQLLAQIPTLIRVRVMQMAVTTPAGRIVVDGNPVTRNAAPNITVDGVKWMLDGVPIEGTFTPRLGAARPNDTAGVEAMFRTLPLTFPQSELAAMLTEVKASHQQLLLHVSGSLSAMAMLTAMQDSGGPSVWAPQRVRFEHGDGLIPELLPQVKDFGIVVVQNPSHLTAVKNLYGSTFTTMQPLKSLLDAKIPLALGSDGPANPFLNILFAAQHPNRPAEAISREQAVMAYTSGSAYAEFAEQHKGTLEPGKLADLAVLSQDIFKVAPSELPKTIAVLTMVGGTIVQQKAEARKVAAANDRTWSKE